MSVLFEILKVAHAFTCDLETFVSEVSKVHLTYICFSHTAIMYYSHYERISMDTLLMLCRTVCF